MKQDPLKVITLDDLIKVLLVDDDEEDYILAKGLLGDVKGNQYDVRWAANSNVALAMMQDEPFDIMLVDFRLGKESGLDLIRTCKQSGSHIPSILLTGQSDLEIDRSAMQAGAVDYLIKSDLNPALLDRAIRYAVANARSEAALRISEARFRSIVDHSSDVISILNADLEISYVSPSIERIFGYKWGDIRNRKMWDLSLNEDIAKLRKFIESLKASPNEIGRLEWRIEDSNGVWYYVETTGKNLLHDPDVKGIVLTTHNIHEQKDLEAQLTHQAFHDSLTNLANRALFRDRVEHAYSRSKRFNTPIAVLYLDLDNFKNINDSQGHSFGDGILGIVSETLKGCIRLSDTIARIGGDEFAILLEDTNQPENAISVAERILESFKTPITINGREIIISTSIGIVTTESEGSNNSADELLRNADVAMYVAKENGKGHYVIFNTVIHGFMLEKMELQADLPAAIENKEFVMHYQPIIDLQSHEVSGFESLIRWIHPRRGPVPPLRFIPIAEDTGLIVPLGRWVLRESCLRLKELQTLCQKKFTMTVNISGRQLQSREFVQDISDILDETGIDPTSVVLEITESMMMEQGEMMFKRLNSIKALGVRLAIDDFGTGYSSLSYLQQLPIDILKIDRSFIAEIDKGFDNSAVARTIISLSETLHLSTIAEGVEKLGQASTLQALSCQYAQGFHFSKPLPIDELKEYLRHELKLPGSSNHNPRHLTK